MITPDQLASSGSESGSQKALFCWSAQSGIPELKWLFAVPNGFFGSVAQKGKMKAEGLKNGVADIMLPVASWCDGKIARGLFVEMKTEQYRNRKNGGLSDDQKEFLDFVSGQGYKTVVCYSWQEARDVILGYLGKDDMFDRN